MFTLRTSHQKEAHFKITPKGVVSNHMLWEYGEPCEIDATPGLSAIFSILGACGKEAEAQQFNAKRATQMPSPSRIRNIPAYPVQLLKVPSCSLGRKKTPKKYREATGFRI